MKQKFKIGVQVTEARPNYNFAPDYIIIDHVKLQYLTDKHVPCYILYILSKDHTISLGSDYIHRFKKPTGKVYGREEVYSMLNS